MEQPSEAALLSSPVPMPPEAPNTNVETDAAQVFDPSQQVAPPSASVVSSPPQEGGQKKKKNPRPRVRWTPEEELALRKGVTKYGAFANCWAKIKQDVELGEILAKRSNVDLKDKWRNTKNHANKLSNRPKRIEDLHAEGRDGYQGDISFQKMIVDDILKHRSRLLDLTNQMTELRESVPGRPDMSAVPSALLADLDGLVKSLQFVTSADTHPTAAQEQEVQAAVMAAAAAAAVSQNTLQQQAENPLHIDPSQLGAHNAEAALALQSLPMMSPDIDAHLRHDDGQMEQNKRFRRA